MWFRWLAPGMAVTRRSAHACARPARGVLSVAWMYEWHTPGWARSAARARSSTSWMRATDGFSTLQFPRRGSSSISASAYSAATSGFSGKRAYTRSIAST